MILVLGGTADGREAAKALENEGLSVLLSTATEYGRELASGTPARAGALDAVGLAALINAEQINTLVDASHPYAIEVSRNAITACKALNIPYIRYERPPVEVSLHHLVYQAENYILAAQKAAELGECIFLTIGSNNLGKFVKTAELNGKRLVARVLPTPQVLATCLELGFSPANLVAMQGPFGLELNKAMLRHYKADVLVSKESGQEGGEDAKIDAAIELGIPIVLVKRPKLDYPSVVGSLKDLKQALQPKAQQSLF